MYGAFIGFVCAIALFCFIVRAIFCRNDDEFCLSSFRTRDKWIKLPV